jgi:hypothetical protein
MFSDVYGEEAIKKSSVSEWHKRLRVRMSKSRMKSVLVTFFDIKGIVHFEFIPQSQTINQTHCVEILKRLREAVRRKRPELCPNDWILHRDNATAHKALSVKMFLAQKSITEVEHPPYPPDLTYGCFQNKVCLKGTKMSGYSRHPRNVKTALKAVHIRSSKNVSNSSSIVGLSAQMPTWSTVQVTHLSML